MKSPVKYIQIHAILLAALVVLLHAVIPHHHHLDAVSDHFASESNNFASESNPFTECAQSSSDGNPFPSDSNESPFGYNHTPSGCDQNACECNPATNNSANTNTSENTSATTSANASEESKRHNDYNAEPCESSDEAKTHCHAFNHIAFNKANSVSVGLRAIPSSVWMDDVTKSTITDLHLSLVVNRLFEVEDGSALQHYAPTRLFRGPPSHA